jgi:hypothetical protein
MQSLLYVALQELVEAVEWQKEAYAIPTSPPASRELLEEADRAVDKALANAKKVLAIDVV